MVKCRQNSRTTRERYEQDIVEDVQRKRYCSVKAFSVELIELFGENREKIVEQMRETKTSWMYAHMTKKLLWCHRQSAYWLGDLAGLFWDSKSFFWSF